VPEALRSGARIMHDASVLHVEVTGSRAVGVRARTASGSNVLVRARHGVLLAASTVQTPGILRRSGLRNEAIGQHFQCHPGHGVAGRFERPVHMDFGAVQGAESIHFRESHGFKLEALAMPPELAAARVPGVGEAFRERLADWSHLAVWVAQFRADAQGTVERTWTGAERVRFTPSESDMTRLRFACATLVRLFFQAGAREVWPGIHGVPQVLRSIDEANLVERGPIDPRAYGMVASHLFGAARMAPDARGGVVGLDFQTHEVERLYVVDSSVFPTNLGVNPQHGIMAMSRLAATRMAERARTSRAA
jgi:choline dehydrogenase-like flavoprotein